MNWRFVSLALPLSLSLIAGGAMAAPSVKVGTLTVIKEGIDAAVEGQLKGASNLAKFQLEKGTDADLAKLCALFPNMKELQIKSGAKISNLAPLGALKSLTRLEVRDSTAKDMTPISGLTGLTSVHMDSAMADLAWMEKLTNLTYVSVSSKNLTSLKGLPKLPRLSKLEIDHGAPTDLTPIAESTPNIKTLRLGYVTVPDMTPLTKLSDLTELDLYGATVKDFSPLAGCAKLKTLTYYATKGADYSTLGKLTQVESLMGGLSQLKDISWVANLPKLKKLRLFAEEITDYTPLAKTNLEYLKIWSMKVPADLAPVGKIKTLKELVIWSLDNASGSKALAGLEALETVTINDYNKKKGGENFDLAAAAGWKNLKTFSTQGTFFDNFGELAKCPKLERVTLLSKTQGANLAALKKMTSLKYVRVDKTLFPESELQGFPQGVSVTSK